jgi:hypothetical protein
MCIDVHLKRVWKSAGFDDMPEPSAKKHRSASKDVDLSSDAPPNSMLQQILGAVNGISARLSVVESKVNGNQIEKPVDNQRQLLDISPEVQLTLHDKSTYSAAAADSVADIASEQSSLAETAQKLLNKLNSVEDKAADSKPPTGALAEKEAAKHAAPARSANPEKASKTFAALLGETTADVKDAAPLHQRSTSVQWTWPSRRKNSYSSCAPPWESPTS